MAQVVLQEMEYFEIFKHDKMLIITVILAPSYGIPVEMIWSLCKENNVLQLGYSTTNDKYILEKGKKAEIA